MANEFVAWLTNEIDKRGWTSSELARRAGLAAATVSLVISEKRQPGWDFCAGVSRAFGLPANEVFRRAGLLPAIPPEIAEEKEVLHILRTLPTQTRTAALAMLRGLVRQIPTTPLPSPCDHPPHSHLDKEILEEFNKLSAPRQEEILRLVVRLVSEQDEEKQRASVELQGD
jgi:transcriptional regulator with XRE-family HTH domain